MNTCKRLTCTAVLMVLCGKGCIGVQNSETKNSKNKVKYQFEK